MVSSSEYSPPARSSSGSLASELDGAPRCIADRNTGLS